MKMKATEILSKVRQNLEKAKLFLMQTTQVYKKMPNRKLKSQLDNRRWMNLQIWTWQFSDKTRISTICARLKLHNLNNQRGTKHFHLLNRRSHKLTQDRIQFQFQPRRRLINLLLVLICNSSVIKFAKNWNLPNKTLTSKRKNI